VRRAALDADREGFDPRRARLGEHIGERPEIRDLDAPEARGFDHRGVIRGDDDLDVLAQGPLEMGLQRLGVLDDRARVFVGQQGHAHPRRIAGRLGGRQAGR
jgi:hypothetical protein